MLLKLNTREALEAQEARLATASEGPFRSWLGRPGLHSDWKHNFLGYEVTCSPAGGLAVCLGQCSIAVKRTMTTHKGKHLTGAGYSSEV